MGLTLHASAAVTRCRRQQLACECCKTQGRPYAVLKATGCVKQPQTASAGSRWAASFAVPCLTSRHQPRLSGPPCWLTCWPPEVACRVCPCPSATSCLDTAWPHVCRRREGYGRRAHAFPGSAVLSHREPCHLKWNAPRQREAGKPQLLMAGPGAGRWRTSAASRPSGGFGDEAALRNLSRASPRPCSPLVITHCLHRPLLGRSERALGPPPCSFPPRPVPTPWA